MHETAIAQSLIDLMVREAESAGGGRIAAARLVLGEMSGVDEETLRFAFDVCTRGTIAEGCRLDVERVPVRLRCRACGAEGADDPFLPCGTCGAVGYEMLSGRELRLASLDLDDDDAGRVPAPEAAT